MDSQLLEKFFELADLVLIIIIIIYYNCLL